MEIKYRGIVSRERVGSNNFGEIQTLFLEHFELLDLIAHWFFVASQSFVAFVHTQLFNSDFFLVGVSHGESRAEPARNHRWFALGTELKTNVVVGALGKFQHSARGPQQVVPQLGIVVHKSQKFFHGRLDFTLEEVGSVGGVINESHHVKIH